MGVNTGFCRCALFTEENTYEITLSNNISNGTASIKTSADKDGKYYASTQVTIEASPADGYVVDHWTKNGSTISGATGTEYKFNPDANAEYGVVFKEKPTEIEIWSGSKNLEWSNWEINEKISVSDIIKIDYQADNGGQMQIYNGGWDNNSNKETMSLATDSQIHTVSITAKGSWIVLQGQNCTIKKIYK